MSPSGPIVQKVSMRLTSTRDNSAKLSKEVKEMKLRSSEVEVYFFAEKDSRSEELQRVQEVSKKSYQ